MISCSLTIPSSHLLCNKKRNSNGNGDSSALDSWSQQEEQNAAASRRAKEEAELDEQLHPKRSTFHKFMYLVSYLVVIAAVNMVIGQIVGMIFENVNIIEIIMRCYVIALCGLVCLVEMEWTKSARESVILRLWITRGLFYAFIGILGLEQNDNATARDGVQLSDLTRNYLRAVAWVMIGCGAIYLIMGATCMQLLYNKQRADYDERMGKSETVRSTVERSSTGPNQV